MRDDVRRVPVRGGELAVEMLPGRTEPVLAIHGVSSQRRLWNWLRAVDPDITVLAPDLRGRGDSIDVTGPSSVDQHVDDLVAVLDAHGLGAVHVCGMSMGGFIAVQLARRFPDRVRSLVLVDGGPPMVQPPGLTRDALPAVFADRLARLEQVWPSVDDYLAFFTTNTAPLLDAADPLLQHYAEHDLRDGRVRLSGQALLDDAGDIFFGPPPIDEVQVPMRLLHAQWSIGPDTAPAYDDALIEAIRHRFAEVRFLPGLDHAGSIMTRAGAAAVAELIRAAAA